MTKTTLVRSWIYRDKSRGLTGSNPVPPTNLNLISPDSYLPENLKIYGSSRAVGARPEQVGKGL